VVVKEVAFNMLKQAAIFLLQDIKAALRKAHGQETSQIGKTQLRAILDNIALAESQQAPICQDACIVVFYIRAGAYVPDLQGVEEALIPSTRKAT
jgi:fumarate hydratase subunit alpha